MELTTTNGKLEGELAATKASLKSTEEAAAAQGKSEGETAKALKKSKAAEAKLSSELASHVKQLAEATKSGTDAAKAAAADAKKLTTALASLTEAKAVVVAELEASKGSVSDLESTVAALKDEQTKLSASAKTEAATKDADAKKVSEALDGAKKAGKKLEQDLAGSKKETKSTEAELKKATEENIKVSSELKSAIAGTSKIETVLKVARKERTALDASVASLESELVALKSAENLAAAKGLSDHELMQTLKEELKKAKTEIAEGSSKLSTALLEIDASKTSSSDKEKDLEAATELVAAVTDESDMLKADLAKSTADVQVATDKVGHMEAKMAAATKDHDVTKTELDLMKEVAVELGKQIGSLKEVATATETDAIQKVEADKQLSGRAIKAEQMQKKTLMDLLQERTETANLRTALEKVTSTLESVQTQHSAALAAEKVTRDNMIAQHATSISAKQKALAETAAEYENRIKTAEELLTVAEKTSAAEQKALKKELKQERKAKERTEVEVAEWAQSVAAQRAAAEAEVQSTKSAAEQDIFLARKKLDEAMEIVATLETAREQTLKKEAEAKAIADAERTKLAEEEHAASMVAAEVAAKAAENERGAGDPHASPERRRELEDTAWCSWERPLHSYRNRADSFRAGPNGTPPSARKPRGSSFVAPSSPATPPQRSVNGSPTLPNDGLDSLDSIIDVPTDSTDHIDRTTTPTEEDAKATIIMQEQEIDFLNKGIMQQVKLAAMLRRQQTDSERELASAKEQIELLVALQGEETVQRNPRTKNAEKKAFEVTLESELKVARAEVESLKEMLELQRQLLHDKAKANQMR
jgi:hypothetical protein